MNLEIKPVYNDFFNKISDKNDLSNSSNNSNCKQNPITKLNEISSSNSSKPNPNCKLDEISSEQEVFKELNNILNSKNPNEYKQKVNPQIKNLNSANNFMSKPSDFNNKINKNNNNHSIKNKINESNQSKIKSQNTINIMSKSDDYTNSSGLGENNMILRNMYLQNINKIQGEKNNQPNRSNQLNESNQNNNIVESNFEKKLSVKNNKFKDESISLVNTHSIEEEIKLTKKKQSTSSEQFDNDPLYEKLKESSSIDDEFKQFFNKDKKKRLDTDSFKQINKLEKYYDKVIKNKLSNNDLVEKKDVLKQKKNNDIDESKYKKSDIVKLVLDKIEKEIYYESTRGYSTEKNIYKMNMEKLKINLEKFKLSPNTKCTVGYIYRNYNNPKVYSAPNENTYWIEVSNGGLMNQVVVNELEPYDKFLNACLKNFKKTTKFKKQIGSNLIRAHIKTVELLNQNNIVIDLIFFVKYKQ